MHCSALSKGSEMPSQPRLGALCTSRPRAAQRGRRSVKLRSGQARAAAAQLRSSTCPCMLSHQVTGNSSSVVKAILSKLCLVSFKMRDSCVLTEFQRPSTSNAKYCSFYGHTGIGGQNFALYHILLLGNNFQKYGIGRAKKTPRKPKIEKSYFAQQFQKSL